jgi:DNA ligase (NAD+)
LETLISSELIREYKDIYRLVEHRPQLIQIEGLGEKSVDNLLESIEKSRTVKLDNFLAALGIEGIGTSAAKTIAEYFDYNLYAVLDAYDQGFDWTQLKDFGNVMANNMNEFLMGNRSKVYILAEELEFIKPAKVEVKTNPFMGKTLVVTGKLNSFTRESINEKIISLGAKTAGSVSKNTDYLITNEASGSSKYKKAMELNIPVLTEAEFLSMI